MEERKKRATRARFEVFESDDAGLEANIGAFETPKQAFTFIDERRQRHPRREHRIVLRASPRRPPSRPEVA